MRESPNEEILSHAQAVILLTTSPRASVLGDFFRYRRRVIICIGVDVY